MDVTISLFTIENYDRAYTLWENCEELGLSDSDSRVNIKLFLERNPGMSYLAEWENELVGTVLAGHDGRRGYIHHLAVAKFFRKHGTGRLLVDHCLKACKSQGILKAHLFMFHNNNNGRKFWKSIGWFERDDLDMFSRFIS